MGRIVYTKPEAGVISKKTPIGATVDRKTVQETYYDDKVIPKGQPMLLLAITYPERLDFKTARA